MPFCTNNRCRLLFAVWLGFGILWGFDQECPADEPAAQDRRVQRVLLLGQKPDGHPWSTHEYMAGARIMGECLQDVPGLQTLIVQADDPWKEGPELLDGADAVVLFLSEGGKWIGSDPKRLAAFQRLAQRGGGLVCLHWGMGCREAKYVEDFVALFGGCHGGPDRKYKVVEMQIQLANAEHPILRGIQPVEVREEFYYRLKFPQDKPGVTPLLQVPIEGETQTVAWAWVRADGGRSGGFSGGHFHENWQSPEYRRLMTHMILWTLQRPIPEEGVPVKVEEKTLKLAPRPEEFEK